MGEKKHQISIVDEMLVETEVLEQSLDDERTKVMEAFSAKYQNATLSGIRLNEEYIASQIRLRGLDTENDEQVHEQDTSPDRPYNANIIRRRDE